MKISAFKKTLLSALFAVTSTVAVASYTPPSLEDILGTDKEGAATLINNSNYSREALESTLNEELGIYVTLRCEGRAAPIITRKDGKENRSNVVTIRSRFAVYSVDLDPKDGLAFTLNFYRPMANENRTDMMLIIRDENEPSDNCSTVL